MTLKQFFCPLQPTWYLVGGAEFGHNWRMITGDDHVICKKCGYKMYVIKYANGSKEAKELLESVNHNEK